MGVTGGVGGEPVDGGSNVGATDLTRDELQARMPGRALRSYPMVVSTEADALAWARQGAPHGALVVAGYQASPRGRSGLSYGDHFTPGHGLGCSLVVRPQLSNAHEGWLYAVGVLGVLDALGDDELAIEWPDQLVRGDEVVAGVGAQVEPGATDLRWGVISSLVPGAEPPRADLLVAVVEATDRWSRADRDAARARYRQRCVTLGRRVRARLLPLGPAARTHTGIADDIADDGGLVIQEDSGARAVVEPQSLGFLEDPDQDASGPGHDHGR